MGPAFKITRPTPPPLWTPSLLTPVHVLQQGIIPLSKSKTKFCFYRGLLDLSSPEATNTLLQEFKVHCRVFVIASTRARGSSVLIWRVRVRSEMTLDLI